MNVIIENNELRFSEDISGVLVLEHIRFNRDETERINVTTMYEGNRRATLPSGLEPGLYNILCEDQYVAKKKYIGQKNCVGWTRTQYKKYGNENLYRHILDFGTEPVLPNEDFWFCINNKKLVLPTSDERKSCFDFLLTVEEPEFHLSEELETFIDLPLRGG